MLQVHSAAPTVTATCPTSEEDMATFGPPPLEDYDDDDEHDGDDHDYNDDENNRAEVEQIEVL